MPDAVRLLLCFLLGAIPFAVVSMWGTGVDITKFGSGNPGFNNVLRYSKWRSAICLIGDAGKGLAAIWLFARPDDTLLWHWACGMAAIAGHCFSPFLGFNGGKGVATAAGVMLYLYPAYLLCSAALYLLLRWVGSRRQWTERGTLASMPAAALFAGLLAVREGTLAMGLGAILLAFVAWRHKKNFKTILGTGLV
jgi:glycerol-3-phosphate acyltransferase PlsY